MVKTTYNFQVSLALRVLLGSWINLFDGSFVSPVGNLIKGHLALAAFWRNSIPQWRQLEYLNFRNKVVIIAVQLVSLAVKTILKPWVQILNRLYLFSHSRRNSYFLNTDWFWQISWLSMTFWCFWTIQLYNCNFTCGLICLDVLCVDQLGSLKYLEWILHQWAHW